MKIEFIKSSLFKTKIIARATEGIEENTKQWVEAVRALGYEEPLQVSITELEAPSNQQYPMSESSESFMLTERDCLSNFMNVAITQCPSRSIVISKAYFQSLLPYTLLLEELNAAQSLNNSFSN